MKKLKARIRRLYAPDAVIKFSFVLICFFIYWITPPAEWADAASSRLRRDSLSVPRIMVGVPLELPEGHFYGPGQGFESIKRRVRLPETDFGEIVLGGQSESITVLVYRSELLDPGPGGYWVFLSANRGERWAPALYTGIGVGEPLVIKPRIHTPIIDAGSIRLEARIPASSTPDGRSRENLLLTLPLETLRKDRDRDGLTDLVEERLLTNPFSIDTDRDGMTDGRDPCPLDARPPAVDQDKVRDAALRALVTGGAFPWAKVARQGGLILVYSEDKTVPHAFTDNPARIIWVGPGDRKRYEAKFGPRQFFKFARIRIDGDSAVVRWQHGGAKGKIALGRREKGWELISDE